MKADKLKAYNRFMKSTAPFRKDKRREIIVEMNKRRPLTEDQKGELEGYKEYFKALEREYKGGTE